MELASRIIEAADLEAAVEVCYQKKWTDGLPVVPPTRGAIERILQYLERDPGDFEAAEAAKGAQAAHELPKWLETRE